MNSILGYIYFNLNMIYENKIYKIGTFMNTCYYLVNANLALEVKKFNLEIKVSIFLNLEEKSYFLDIPNF